MRKKILITDSSPSMCMLISSFLEPLDVDTQTAHNGEECLEKAVNWNPDLITLDLQMDGMNGMETCIALKKLPETHLIPVAIVTAIDEDSIKTEAFEAGAMEYLVKPFSPEYFVERVRSVLELPASTEALKQKVLVAEDTRTILSMYKFLLPQVGCDMIGCEDGQIALDTLGECYQEVELIISDLNMPNMNGEEFVRRARADSRFDQIPIIVATTVSELEQIKKLLHLGVSDYITKPFSHEEFTARIRAHLRTRQLSREQERLNLELKHFNEELEEKVRLRTQELREAHYDTIFMLALASDAKDKDTANHIHRVCHYSTALALKCGHDQVTAEEIGISSMMHDVGKIAIPDHILNKPGKLDADEWEVMKTHTLHGERILGDKPFFQRAREIAKCHHEKVDGSGYPLGLKGENIPESARITTVADVYDALCSRRVYKPAWSEEEVIAELKRSSGSHLDGHIVNLFLDLVADGTIAEIRKRFPN